MDVVTLKLANQYTDASGGGGGGGIGGNVPAGGYVGQVLTKKSDENYDSEWQDVPAGDWDTLQNRPFGYEHAFIDWDGNTEGKKVIDRQYYKISDVLFPVDYVGAFIYVNGEVWEITHDMVSYGENYTDVSINGKVYIKEYWDDLYGVYFFNDGTEYVQRVERSYIKKIDPNFVDTINPDWNDNDYNSPRHIYGRTHWIEYNYAEPVEFPESELSWQNTGATIDGVSIDKAEGTNDLIPNANISLGEYVIVRWGENGGSWTAIAYDPASYGIEFEGGILLGNMALHPDSGANHFDSGEPYLILLRGNEYVMYTRETEIPSPSVVLDVMSETVYPLDERFIPNSIMRTADVDAAVETALEGKVAQSDLAVNDETDPSYVKNRTHHVEHDYFDPVEVAGSDIVWSRTADEYQGEPISTSQNVWAFASSFEANAGDVFIIQWGEYGTYECVAEDLSVITGDTVDSGIIFLGNQSLYPSSIKPELAYDSGEPFCATIQGNSGWYFDARMSQTPTDSVVVTQDRRTVYPLDDMYIPETVARKKDIVQSDLSVNDESSASYVKNRTHWVDGQLYFADIKPLFLALIGTDQNNVVGYYFQAHKSRGEVLDKEGNALSLLNVYSDLIVGETYAVRFPLLTGEDYIELECKVTGSSKYFGNNDIINSDGQLSGGAEDFAIVIQKTSIGVQVKKGFFEAQPNAGDVIECQILRDTRVYHHLDENFIPETIARKEPVDAAIAQLVSTLQNAKKHTFGVVYFAPAANTDVEMRMLSSIYTENSHIGIDGENKYFNAPSIFNVTFSLNFDAQSEVSYSINSASLDFGAQGTIPAGRSQHIVKFVVDVPFLTGGMGSEFTLNDLKFNCTGDVTLKDSYYTVEEYQMG